MKRAGDLKVRAEYLDDAAIAALLEQRQAEQAGTDDADWEQGAAVLRWSLGSEHYATRLADIRAVAPLPRLTRVPGGPPALLGIAHWRGAVLNVFDPATALDTPSAGEGGTMLVLRNEAPRLALRVSAAVGVAYAVADATGKGMSEFIETGEGERFALVSTALLVGQLLARRAPKRGKALSISNRIIVGFGVLTAILIALGFYALAVQVGAVRSNVDVIVQFAIRNDRRGRTVSAAEAGMRRYAASAGFASCRRQRGAGHARNLSQARANECRCAQPASHRCRDL